MKKTLCFYFQVHQPFRLRRYRFFDIGSSHQYYDEFNNRSIMRKIAERCYTPMNKLLLQLIKEYGKQFKLAFSITGQAIEQMELYAPEALDSFRELAATGCVEFLCETYAHSLAVLKDVAEFERQVALHSQLIEWYFGQKPTTFRLTELIYSDEIGVKVAGMGFTTMLTEGAKHVLGWKSPNYMYTNSINSRLKVLLRNFRLSDDISFRFSDRAWSEWPVTSEKYVGWLKELDPKEEIVNIFMDYETFGEHQRRETGIFEFMRYLPEKVFSSTNFEFLTPCEAAKKHQPVAPIHVPFAISWADEERDLSAWVGNELQDDAFNSIYEYGDVIAELNDEELMTDWRRLQASDHFYYMCTKFFSDGNVHKYFNPYANPYEAYINYMNIVSDFLIRVNKLVDKKIDTELKNEKNVENFSNFASTNQISNSSLQIKKSLEMAKRTTLADLAKEGPLPGVAKKEAAKKKVAAKKEEKKVPPKKATTAKPAVKKAAAPTKKVTTAKPTVKKAAAPAKKATTAKPVAKKVSPAKKATTAKPATKKTAKK
jgi:alpha-amylase